MFKKVNLGALLLLAISSAALADSALVCGTRVLTYTETVPNSGSYSATPTSVSALENVKGTTLTTSLSTVTAIQGEDRAKEFTYVVSVENGRVSASLKHYNFTNIQEIALKAGQKSVSFEFMGLNSDGYMSHEAPQSLQVSCQISSL